MSSPNGTQTSLMKNPMIQVCALELAENQVPAVCEKEFGRCSPGALLMIMAELTGDLIRQVGVYDPKTAKVRLSQLSAYLKDKTRTLSPACSLDLLVSADQVLRHTAANDKPWNGPDLTAYEGRRITEKLSDEGVITLKNAEKFLSSRYKLSNDGRIAASFDGLFLRMTHAFEEISAPIAYRIAMEVATHEVMWGGTEKPASPLSRPAHSSSQRSKPPRP